MAKTSKIRIPKSKKLAIRGRGVLGGSFYVEVEPVVTENTTRKQMIDVYGWYGHFFEATDSQKFVVDYLKSIEYPKEKIQLISQLGINEFNSLGWNCRILQNGGYLPQEKITKIMRMIENLIKKVKPIEISAIEIKEHISDTKFQILVGNLENEIDKLLNGDYKYVFDTYGHLTNNKIPTSDAKEAGLHYGALYNELIDVLSGEIPELQEGYKKLKPKQVSAYLNFIGKIINDCETYVNNRKKQAKPRTTKAKTANQITKKVKFLEKFDELQLVSVLPEQIVGSIQAWLYNTKTKILSHYMSETNQTLTFKGTKLIHFDVKNSQSRRLRKPELTLKEILNSGKVSAIKVFDDLNTKASPVPGRINTDTIVLRVIK